MISNKIALLITILFLTSGCSPTWRHVRTIEKSESTNRIGVLSSEIDKYHAPRIISVPSNTNQIIVLKFEKIVKDNVQYSSKIFKQKVLNRKIRLSDVHRENVINEITEGDSIPLKLIAIIGLPLNILLSPVWDKFGGKSEIQTKLIKIPDSDSIKVFRDIEYNSVPASGIKVYLDGVGEAYTDYSGVATFKVSPDSFDKGIIVRSSANEKRYVIERKKYSKHYTYYAPWRDVAQFTSNAHTAYLVFKKAKNIIAVGGGPYAIAGAVAVEIASGLFVGYVIDIAATRKVTKDVIRWKIQTLN